ncbi:hypothetical protein GWK47_054048 [Chionoecetes opilio]|uniref:Uncharacterized protein n=1 Tax=Chionoecetes opilio TaxID=41210 RepID=A0A8J4Y6F6_CHIOP|nr:hypothetical protein GWK47_054048 [Chionoecetes opilio]
MITEGILPNKPLSEKGGPKNISLTPPLFLFQYGQPFGMRNAPLPFQRAMGYFFQDLVEFCNLAKILIFTGIGAHLLKNPGRVTRLQEAQLTIKLAKTTFSRATGHPGHGWGQGPKRPLANIPPSWSTLPYTRKAPGPFGMGGGCDHKKDGRLPSRLNQLKNFRPRGPCHRSRLRQTLCSEKMPRHRPLECTLQEVEGFFTPFGIPPPASIHQNGKTIGKNPGNVSAVQKFQFISRQVKIL